MKPFIPKQTKTEQITLRLDQEKLEKIDLAAAAYHVSRARFINQCIDYALENIGESVWEQEEE